MGKALRRTLAEDNDINDAHVLHEAVWHGHLRGGQKCIVSFQAV